MSSWIDISAVSQNKSVFQNLKSHEDKSSLGKDDFLRILTTQLSNQDPSNPLQDKEFIAQMATFSTLEQMTNLNKTFEKFASSQMSQYTNAIGKEITWTPADTSTPVTGTVTGVSAQEGNFYYMVGEEKVPTNLVTEITQKEEAAN
jgi:flagellar basal-body rod modification protein FlgD